MQVISAELRSSKHWELTEEGMEIAENGSHEARVFSSIPLEGLAQSELMVSATGGRVRSTTVGVTCHLEDEKLVLTLSLIWVQCVGSGKG